METVGAPPSVIDVIDPLNNTVALKDWTSLKSVLFMAQVALRFGHGSHVRGAGVGYLPIGSSRVWFLDGLYR